jgi:hypothetical protein
MILTDNKRPAESGHWYALDGTPMYEIVGANGNKRPTNLRDARKLNLVPSVTGIIKCAASPGLENWKAEQLMLAALTLPRNPDEVESAWLDRVRHDSRETARKAAERGTAIHAAIEQYYWQRPTFEYQEHAIGTAKHIDEVCGKQRWLPEQSFAHRLGYGGKNDLHNPAWCLDFKTKEFNWDDVRADKLKTWDEHAMQLAACREGLNIPNALCGIVYVSVTVPGLARLLVIEEEKIRQGWEMFKSLLSYWQVKNNYRPVFEKVAA